MSRIQLTHQVKRYNEGPDTTRLNTVDLWIPDSVSNDPEKLWVIYIHGGAWRDPKVGSRSFEPAIHELWQSSIRESIAGFASIDYRLSPYSTHSDEPSSDDDPSRNVHYPSHLLDVVHALLFLEDEYRISNRYVLIGHSAGATMTFELHNCYIPGSSLPTPACVLGISGIYNFETFVENHSSIPVYREIMENAFPDRSSWAQASPYASTIAGLAAWESARAIIISYSDDDELVEEAQATLMLDRISRSTEGKDKVHYLQANGAHDEIWQSGSILAGLIEKAIDILGHAK